MKKKELIKLEKESVDTLRAKVLEIKKEWVLTLARLKAGRETNLKKGKALKRDIAQILTLISAKKEGKEKA